LRKKAEKEMRSRNQAKLTHIAPLVLVGWYLLVPPSQDTNLPISQWNHIGSFDTAAECEKNRVDLHRQNLNDPAKDQLILLSECIASDDPRLAK
jgi:hypothetical protein